MVSTPEQDEEAPAPGDIQSAAPVGKENDNRDGKMTDVGRSSNASASCVTFDESHEQMRCNNCDYVSDWSKQRKILTVFGCLSRYSCASLD
jgi:hypothetical protein